MKFGQGYLRGRYIAVTSLVVVGGTMAVVNIFGGNDDEVQPLAQTGAGELVVDVVDEVPALTQAELDTMATEFRADYSTATTALSDAAYQVHRLAAEMRSANPDEVERTDFSNADTNDVNAAVQYANYLIDDARP